jgi:hypothetical protein
MTEHGFAISPHVFARFLPDRSRLEEQRAQGTPGAPSPSSAFSENQK